jgi:hypothetical protein
MKITRCFSEITPESAEQGDFSDQGLVYENQDFTFSELVREIEQGGFTRQGETDWLETAPWIESFCTMTERTESLHFSCANPPHLRKWFDLALRFLETKSQARRQAVTS